MEVNFTVVWPIGTEIIQDPVGNCTPYPMLKLFDDYYKPIHAYLSLGVCMLGIFTNLLNAVILTHRMMRSPTNMLLTAIALADSLTMITYLIKDVYLHFITSPEPQGAAHRCAEIYLLLGTNFMSIGGHIVATVMTVMLAAFRCWVLYYPTKQITYQHTTVTAIIALLVALMVSIPGLFTFIVVPMPAVDDKENCWFELRNGTEYLDRANFAIYGCFIKLVASFLIALFTGLILAAMDRARRRYFKLKQNSIAVIGQSNSPQTCYEENSPLRKTSASAAEKKRDATQVRSNQRTTIMLMAVVVSFVITEAPQGVINALVTSKGNCFLFNVYVPIGDLLDLLVLLNSSTNFMLYCAMSAQFRESFRQLIFRPFGSPKNISGEDTDRIRQAARQSIIKCAWNRISAKQCRRHSNLNQSVAATCDNFPKDIMNIKD